MPLLLFVHFLENHFSLFNETDSVTKKDYDGDGDPGKPSNWNAKLRDHSDINPVGKIHRNCSRTLSKDAPDFDTRGTAWAALDQCEMMYMNPVGSGELYSPPYL